MSQTKLVQDALHLTQLCIAHFNLLDEMFESNVPTCLQVGSFDLDVTSQIHVNVSKGYTLLAYASPHENRMSVNKLITPDYEVDSTGGVTQ